MTDEEDIAIDKLPIKAIRDRIFKIHKDLVKINKELYSFRSVLSEKSHTAEHKQDIYIMEAAILEMGKAISQLENACKWVSFIKDYGPISDI